MVSLTEMIFIVVAVLATSKRFVLILARHSGRQQRQVYVVFQYCYDGSENNHAQAQNLYHQHQAEYKPLWLKIIRTFTEIKLYW